MNEFSEMLIPFGFFTCLVCLVWLLLAYRLKQRKALLNTIEIALKADKNLQPEIIKAISSDMHNDNIDLRKGSMFLAVALSICLFSWILDMPSNGNFNLTRVMLGLAIFPGLVGFTYLLLHFFQAKKIQQLE